MVDVLLQREERVLPGGPVPLVLGNADDPEAPRDLPVGDLGVGAQRVLAGEHEQHHRSAAQVLVAAVLSPPPEQEGVVGGELRSVVRRLGGQGQLEQQVEGEMAGDPDLDRGVGLQLGEAVVGPGRGERAVERVPGRGRPQLGGGQDVSVAAIADLRRGDDAVAGARGAPVVGDHPLAEQRGSAR